jgi:hypothetical protein
VKYTMAKLLDRPPYPELLTVDAQPAPDQADILVSTTTPVNTDRSTTPADDVPAPNNPTCET